VNENYERGRDARETVDIELKALIGILILAGVSKSRRQNILNLFDASKGTGLESVYLTMNVMQKYQNTDRRRNSLYTRVLIHSNKHIAN